MQNLNDIDRNDGRSHANICFDCQNAVCGCNWSRNFKPVPGWEAELTVVNHNITYYITGCPEYIPDVKRTNTSGILYDEDEEEFFSDPITFIERHCNGTLSMRQKHAGRPKKEEKSA